MLTDKLIKENITRLNKIEGQVRGIKNMIEDKRYCIDILTQIKAIKSALSKVEEIILQNHINTCVRNSMANSNQKDIDEKIEEIIKTISKFTR